MNRVSKYVSRLQGFIQTRINLVIYVLFFSGLFIGLFVSCQNKGIFYSENEQPDLLIEQAKTTFSSETKIIINGGREASNPNKLSPNKWGVDWSQSTTYKLNGVQVVEAPLLYDSNEMLYTVHTQGFSDDNDIPNRNGVTKAVFFKHSDGSMNGYVARFILNEGYFSQKKAKNEYKKLSLDKLSKDYSGFIIMTNWEGKGLDLYHYKNGKIIASTRSKNETQRGGREAACEQTVLYRWVCTSVSLQCCTPEEAALDPGSVCCLGYGQSCYYEPYGILTVCTPDNPIEPSTGSDPTPSPTEEADNSLPEGPENQQLVLDVASHFSYLKDSPMVSPLGITWAQIYNQVRQCNVYGLCSSPLNGNASDASAYNIMTSMIGYCVFGAIDNPDGKVMGIKKSCRDNTKSCKSFEVQTMHSGKVSINLEAQLNGPGGGIGITTNFSSGFGVPLIWIRVSR